MWRGFTWGAHAHRLHAWQCDLYITLAISSLVVPPLLESSLIRIGPIEWSYNIMPTLTKLLDGHFFPQHPPLLVIRIMGKKPLDDNKVVRGD